MNSMIEVKNKVCIENVIISVSIHSCILWEVKIVKILLSLIQYQKSNLKCLHQKCCIRYEEWWKKHDSQILKRMAIQRFCDFALNFQLKNGLLASHFCFTLLCLKPFVDQSFYTIRLIKFSILMCFLFYIKYACFDVFLSTWKCDSIKD